MNFINVRRLWRTTPGLRVPRHRLEDSTIERHEAGRPRYLFPLVNIYEAADAFVVRVELPGMKADEVTLDVTGDSLRLAGERRRRLAIDEASCRRQERWFGQWERELSFPHLIDTDDVTAQMASGTLTIHLPKVRVSQPRRVPIEPQADETERSDTDVRADD
ncbi:Spore protein SP21 [Planctomycetes bacterium Pan216]|uniref:Spore protein SP21 n=1 Tax=Kolteria novifilia TaxID=2527975 RepID=A0A518B6Y1_9BACT|nr:Spore protein SP21 [Planctomycetes bacterium Pan216]